MYVFGVHWCSVYIRHLCFVVLSFPTSARLVQRLVILLIILFPFKKKKLRNIVDKEVISVDKLQHEHLCSPMNQKDHKTRKEHGRFGNVHNIQLHSVNVPSADETDLTGNLAKKIVNGNADIVTTVTDLEWQNGNDLPWLLLER
ncbi:hypothetical protein QL285_082807 [Trifolium repens]|nr:hypothetical protein QL285_082807 [Trifolium repens]